MIISITAIQAAPHTSVGLAYQYLQSEDPNHSLVGIEIGGLTGRKIGFLYDLAVLVPLNQLIDPARLDYCNLQALIGVGFKPIDEAIMLDFGLGFSPGLTIGRNLGYESNATTGINLGLGGHLGLGVALGDLLVLSLECDAVYYLLYWSSPAGVFNLIYLSRAAGLNHVWSLTPSLSLCFRKY